VGPGREVMTLRRVTDFLNEESLRDERRCWMLVVDDGKLGHMLHYCFCVVILLLAIGKL
jgi:hypothetical protein